MDIEHIIENIEGKMAPASCRALYEYAKEVSDKHYIVELGTFKGRSLCCLGLGSMEGNGSKVVAVDIWETGVWNPTDEASINYQKKNFEIFLSNVELYGLSDIVSYLKGRTDEVVKDWVDDIGLLHIDANHEYEMVSADYKLWSPHVVDEGLILFHDYHENFPGVMKCIDELLDCGSIEEIGRADTLFITRQGTGLL